MIPKQFSSYSKLEYALRDDNTLLSFYKESPILIAAPHHTVQGQIEMYNNDNGIKFGDQNTGILALLIAQELKANLIICARPNHDPNKIEGQYTSLIREMEITHLVEIHTHWRFDKDGELATDNDIEVSTGSKLYNGYAMHLASLLREGLSMNISGNFTNIYYKAKKTYSLKMCRKKGIIPFHLEFYKGLIDDEHIELRKKIANVVSDSLVKFI